MCGRESAQREERTPSLTIYAMAAGNQAYQEAIRPLYDRGMQLAQFARENYDKDRADLYNQMGAIKGMDESDYGRYLDTMDEWRKDEANATEAYRDEREDMWIDESGENDVLRQYSAVTEEWTEVATTYVKIAGTGIGAGLKEYDCIEISGMRLGGEDPDVRLEQQVSMLNGSMIIYYAEDDYIVVAGLISQQVETGGLEGTVNADLEIPDMDYIVESNNRLWGCKYGLVDGKVVNEIYASKLGDFRNWRCYMGLSTDSYTLPWSSVG